MADPKITDNDAGEITATVNGAEVRGWSYKTSGEQREKMRMAHEFAEGWFQATERAAKVDQPAATSEMLAALQTVGRVLSEREVTRTDDELWAAYSHVIAAIAKATETKP